MDKIDPVEKTQIRSFQFEYILVDDDEALSQIMKTTLKTRKLRRLCESVIRVYFDMPVKVRSVIYCVNNGEYTRKLLAKLNDGARPLFDQTPLS